MAGVDLRFQFFNYTTQTAANPGELLIQMDAQFGGGAPRLASTFGQYNALTIIFHRRNAVNGTPWNFVPYNAAPGEFDMQTILMHELGHCHGLDHSASANDTMSLRPSTITKPVRRSVPAPLGSVPLAYMSWDGVTPTASRPGCARTARSSSGVGGSSMGVNGRYTAQHT